MGQEREVVKYYLLQLMVASIILGGSYITANLYICFQKNGGQYQLSLWASLPDRFCCFLGTEIIF